MNLKELSQHLGLSQTTVSRALNGYPEVGEATRKRVTEEAHRQGYRPNANARRLATGRSHVIGYVFPSDRSIMIDPIFSDFIAGAADIQSMRGFETLLHAGGEENEMAVYRRYAEGGLVDGVVVQAPHMDDPRLALLDSLDLPYVVHGRVGTRQDGYAWLDIDNRGAFHKATKLLTDLGHTRIGLLNGLEYLTYAQHRREGYEKALHERGLAVDPSIMFSGQLTEENGYRQAKRLLQSQPRPTALVMSSMLMVSGALRAVHELGLAVGTDVSLIGHDDGLPFLNAEGLVPSLTTTSSSIRAAGSRVAELLLSLIENTNADLPQEMWSVDLIVRGSTGPVPG
ncbi:LacI family DNA-binding transcriptional regulator [Aestuariivirga litoralis]|uniref:LacI family DNA-binding transcriptional regulator n=1 Tax=Aestuariivirga litoralis TaxID=2650924 RepID=UPI0018C5C700|nr:substrate-binding domain-containing protein [Aestuariivirga litoralis]MBG1232557.1 LacI family transcriptional regulator [Aestuariivirga litoralis]